MVQPLMRTRTQAGATVKGKDDRFLSSYSPLLLSYSISIFVILIFYTVISSTIPEREGSLAKDVLAQWPQASMATLMNRTSLFASVIRRGPLVRKLFSRPPLLFWGSRVSKSAQERPNRRLVRLRWLGYNGGLFAGRLGKNRAAILRCDYGPKAMRRRPSKGGRRANGRGGHLPAPGHGPRNVRGPLLSVLRLCSG